ncbi:LysR family transcriptional regulator [Martelella mediterranea]|uniref:DNA-binding transcriptional LysR family regulator n=1 Tax=Martelella mediterranea TaxID=293089 RepID=A0A4R3P5P0_9HYPH|nr:LysR family transcriptional regulator [Martelella mediterranea]TCT44992.1 DNA-binding transcriptional LysR family regulator [Martelella mediterranea]
MAKPDHGWDHYRTLLAVLETGSLSAAARKLGITQPTAGRHIEALEEDAGQQLFTRSQRGLEPTETARSLKGYAETMASAADAIKRATSEESGTVSGSVRVSASEVIAIEVLPPIIAPLLKTHEKLKVELSVSDQIEDLLHRQADIALRMVEPAQDALVTKFIGRIPIACFAHRDFIAEYGMPESFDDLAKMRCIGFDHQLAYVRDVLKAFPSLAIPDFSFRSDSNLAQLAAIRAGCGIGFCQVPLGRSNPDLVEVLKGKIPFSLPVWIAMHEDLRHAPRCRATFDTLAEGMSAYIRRSAA